MNGLRRIIARLVLAFSLGGAGGFTPSSPAASDPGLRLPNTAPLTEERDLSVLMVEGIRSNLLNRTQLTLQSRAQVWSSPGNNRASLIQRLKQSIGLDESTDPATSLEFVTQNPGHQAQLTSRSGVTLHRARWQVFPDVAAEGLVLLPPNPSHLRGCVIHLPDPDLTPEAICGWNPDSNDTHPAALQLAAQNFLVLIPTLLSREHTRSGSDALHRFTRLPHREWIYRQAFELGRHPIGYELEVARTGLTAALKSFPSLSGAHHGIIGSSTGAWIALLTAALDERFTATWVIGSLSAREHLDSEPIDHNVWNYHQLGDAGVAALIAPRALLVDPVDPAPLQSTNPVDRGGAAPGHVAIATPEDLASEIKLAARLAHTVQPHAQSWSPTLTPQPSNRTTTPGGGPGSASPLSVFLQALAAPPPSTSTDQWLTPLPPPPDPAAINARQARMVRAWEAHTQNLLRQAERIRDQATWPLLTPGPDRSNRVLSARSQLWNDVIGRLPDPDRPPNPRTRPGPAGLGWTSEEVQLEVGEDLFAWGFLLLPNDLRPGERRPVVVCQHGLEGLPIHTITGPGTPGYEAYKGFSAQLAQRGYIVFAPHNPYRGEDRFRSLQRLANPLGLSIFSFITRQHQQVLRWLGTLPFVDPQRIAFYGLSYGGKTAMRVPALLPDYCLSICSADFNDWITKNVTVDSNYSYLYTGEYELPEFNLGRTFNYAEMAALIAPRPFMVERGHDDGVAPDSWVASEYARVRRHYVKLGIGNRTEIEFFDGPHTINGQGTFRFLDRHLGFTPHPPTPNASP